ncbi:HET-domain-containing protein [Lentithecium fluviatile CBS 122367]|uniref:HET-domain-containing protein n=1 Tax=Lentithecium fluviatile CBS 122367 TaxID=1168545 RepID=A0A6G1JE67_9PLEO|nr:HET-domain-containing protein [Lentithecium fluviatile CBS 122367]
MKGRSLDDLLASASNCPICMELNEVLRGHECELHDLGEGATIPFDVHLVSQYLMPQTIEVFPRTSSARDRSEDSLHHWNKDWSELLRNPELGRYNIRQYIERKPSSTEYSVYRGMRSCFEKCLAAHRICRADTDRLWLPTRLIDVQKMKLKPSAKISLIGDRRYVALGHQWGTIPFFTLERDNLDILSNSGIRLPDLRRTFIDAIEVTRQLGVRYLWIDSLCIIQGEKGQSEWHREAASMAQVYRNAIVTLAASNATSVYEGFFGKSQNAWLNVVTPLGNSQGLNLLLSKGLQKPLDRRAWVLQEHLLSPRTIHFGDPVTWECREMTVKQTCDSLSILPSFSTPKVWTAGLRRRDCLGLWKQLVAKYSDCLLTVPSDKLVAIGGLARIFFGVLKCDYLAGIWRERVVEDLLWETASSKAARVGRYRAPSWSWASIEGGIKFQSFPQRYTLLAEILDARIDPAESDPFGEVRNGHLLVNARLLPLGAFDGRASKTLIHSDDFLRVSLDGLPSTQDGRLYLLPLVKLDTEDQYWSLLLKERESNFGPAVPEYQRLGVVTTFLKRGCSSLLTKRNLENPLWWPKVFYPRDVGPGDTARAFKEEDFKGGHTQKVRLV